jgi:ribosomal protein S18 acetylase RimI-like enzyme
VTVLGSDPTDPEDATMGPSRREGQSVPPDPGRPHGTEPTVRPGTESDAAAAAALHAGQIDSGFLSTLGTRFLNRLYRRICLAPGSFLVVAADGDLVIGFIAGTRDVGALYRTFLWRDGLAAAADVVGRLIRNWRLVVETLRHGSSGGAGTGRGVELLAMAVDPAYRGRGLGTRLVASFLDQVSAIGQGESYVVVAGANPIAIGLYTQAGFTPDGQFELHAGTRSLLMQREGKPHDPSSGPRP